MALITCPECGAKVSDRARTCPSCGYPIDEYLEEERIKKEEQEENERVEKILASDEYKKLEVKRDFVFGKSTISFTENEKINCIIDKKFDKSILHMQKILFNQVYNFNEYSPITADGIYENGIWYWIRETSREAAKTYAELKKKYYDPLTDVEIVTDDILDQIDRFGFSSSVFNKLYGVCSQCESDMELAGQNIQCVDYLVDEGHGLIDEVRSFTLGGLIVGKLEADIVNGITRGLTKTPDKKVKQLIEERVQEYYNVVREGNRAFFLTLIENLYGITSEICMSLKNELYEDYKLVESLDYIPHDKKKLPNTKALSEITKREAKYKTLAEELKADPCNIFHYVEALVDIEKDDRVLDSLKAMTQYFEIDADFYSDVNFYAEDFVFTDADDIDKLLKKSPAKYSKKDESSIVSIEAKFNNFENAAKAWPFTVDEKFKEKIEKLVNGIVSVDGYRFSSAEEKHAYMDEKALYALALKKIYDGKNWITSENIESLHDEITTLHKPVIKENESAYYECKDAEKRLYDDSQTYSAGFVRCFVSVISNCSIYFYPNKEGKKLEDECLQIMNLVDQKKHGPILFTICSTQPLVFTIKDVLLFDDKHNLSRVVNLSYFLDATYEMPQLLNWVKGFRLKTKGDDVPLIGIPKDNAAIVRKAFITYGRLFETSIGVEEKIQKCVEIQREEDGSLSVHGESGVNAIREEFEFIVNSYDTGALERLSIAAQRYRLVDENNNKIVNDADNQWLNALSYDYAVISVYTAFKDVFLDSNGRVKSFDELGLQSDDQKEMADKLSDIYISCGLVTMGDNGEKHFVRKQSSEAEINNRAKIIESIWESAPSEGQIEKERIKENQIKEDKAKEDQFMNRGAVIWQNREINTDTKLSELYKVAQDAELFSNGGVPQEQWKEKLYLTFFPILANLEISKEFGGVYECLVAKNITELRSNYERVKTVLLKYNMITGAENSLKLNDIFKEQFEWKDTYGFFVGDLWNTIIHYPICYDGLKFERAFNKQIKFGDNVYYIGIDDISSKSRQRLCSLLCEDEHMMLAVNLGSCFDKGFIVSDKRLIWMADDQVNSVKLSEINSISLGKGLLSRYIVVNGTKHTELNLTGMIKPEEFVSNLDIYVRAVNASGNVLSDSSENKKMFCPHCGKQIERAAKFCAFCGAKNTYIMKGV